MSIDHRSTQIIVSKQFLEGTNIVSIFEQMRRKTMSEGMFASLSLELAGFDTLRHSIQGFRGYPSLSDAVCYGIE